MIGILVVTHGKLAEGLLDAMRMIVGQQEALQMISLQESDSVDELDGRIQKAVTVLNQGDGVLILVDLFGASPFNASARVALQQPDKDIEVMTGVSLPMLIETVMQRTGDIDLPSLVQVAKEAANGSVKVLSEEWSDL